jgi:hypothetical protein
MPTKLTRLGELRDFIVSCKSPYGLDVTMFTWEKQEYYRFFITHTAQMKSLSKAFE